MLMSSYISVDVYSHICQHHLHIFQHVLIHIFMYQPISRYTSKYIQGYQHFLKYMPTYTYMHAKINIHICPHMGTCTSIHIFQHTLTNMTTVSYACVYTNIQLHICQHLLTYMPTYSYIYANIHNYIYASIYSHTCVHIITYMLTYTYIYAKQAYILFQKSKLLAEQYRQDRILCLLTPDAEDWLLPQHQHLSYQYQDMRKFQG